MRLGSDRLTVVWLGLVLATGLSWAVGCGAVESARLATPLVLAIAFVKARYIGMDFMELRGAPPLLRGAFNIWALAMWGLLTGLSWVGPS